MGNKNTTANTTILKSSKDEYEKLKESLYNDILNGMYTYDVNLNEPIYKFNLEILNDKLGDQLLEQLILGDCNEKELNLLLENGASPQKKSLSGMYVIDYMFEYKFYELVVKCVEHGSTIPREMMLKCLTQNIKKDFQDLKTYNFRLLETFKKYGCPPLTMEELIQIYKFKIRQIENWKFKNFKEDVKYIMLKSFKKNLEIYKMLFENKLY
jgi:hypothetical protein